jgi:hypothetical protein
MEPQDHGPIYKETLMGRLPVEPWNTFSNLLFLAIILYWTWKLWGNYRKHPFIAGTLPVLFIGYVGGTIYHATRSSDLWLYMDWVPILLLSIAGSAYYFSKLKFSWSYTTMIIAPPFLMIFVMRYFLEAYKAVKGMIGYPILAFIVLFPIFRYLSVTQWRDAKWVWLSMGTFALAVLCRGLDWLIGDSEIFYMGTHWLWHSFGAIAVHLLLVYIYKDGERGGRAMVNG